uniref:Uncharacterized protein n=1 Tax=Avena sativa TaxID=4498 RepID=A0ACD5X1K9_AVESA
MAKNHLLILLVLAASLAASSATITKSDSSATPTVYELLAKYNFPPGILPEGVQNYTIAADGSFGVTLPGECEIDVAGFTLRYDSEIQGSIQSMLISGLNGVSVNLGINRVAISSVERDGDRLKFHAGLISKSFPVSSFAMSPRCNPGAGFAK